MSLFEIPIVLTADQRELLREETGKDIRAVIITFEEEFEEEVELVGPWHGVARDGEPHPDVDVDP